MVCLLIGEVALLLALPFSVLRGGRARGEGRGKGTLSRKPPSPPPPILPLLCTTQNNCFRFQQCYQQYITVEEVEVERVKIESWT